MPKLGSLKLPYPKGLPKMHSFKSFMARDLQPPTIGVTQGGSSRDDAGARVAATNGLAKPIPYTYDYGEEDV